MTKRLLTGLFVAISIACGESGSPTSPSPATAVTAPLAGAPNTTVTPAPGPIVSQPPPDTSTTPTTPGPATGAEPPATNTPATCADVPITRENWTWKSTSQVELVNSTCKPITYTCGLADVKDDKVYAAHTVTVPGKNFDPKENKWVGVRGFFTLAPSADKKFCTGRKAQTDCHPGNDVIIRDPLFTSQIEWDGDADCTPTTTPTCPAGQVGTYPNCTTPPQVCVPTGKPTFGDWIEGKPLAAGATNMHPMPATPPTPPTEVCKEVEVEVEAYRKVTDSCGKVTYEPGKIPKKVKVCEPKK